MLLMFAICVVNASTGGKCFNLRVGMIQNLKSTLLRILGMNLKAAGVPLVHIKFG
jgi:hypothetical protein